jgi:hypothetical protein
MAFEYCTELKQIHLPDTLNRIPMSAFNFCGSLRSITLPKALVSIGDNAFASCAITQIELPQSLKALGYGAFAGTPLTELTLPQELTELRDYALVNCSLEELTIPASVTFIGNGFASGSPLHTLHFLGNAPFFEEYALESLCLTAYYPAGNKTWTKDLLQSYGGDITWVPEGNPGIALSGTVMDGATLTLLLGDEVIETCTASQCSYRFENLLPGNYILTASATNHVLRSYRLTVADQPLTQDIQLHLIGDIDGNGKVNIGDVAKLAAHIKGSAPLTDEYALECANVNGGKLNMGDTASLYSHIRGTKKLY